MRYENRPFECARDMNNIMLENWNGIVKDKDKVYVLGDFEVDELESSILKQLNGTKYLIKGNHDIKSNDYL